MPASSFDAVMPGRRRQRAPPRRRVSRASMWHPIIGGPDVRPGGRRAGPLGGNDRVELGPQQLLIRVDESKELLAFVYARGARALPVDDGHGGSHPGQASAAGWASVPPVRKTCWASRSGSRKGWVPIGIMSTSSAAEGAPGGITLRPDDL